MSTVKEIPCVVGSSSGGGGSSIEDLLTIFDEKTSLYIVFEDGTILVGTT
jgi:hypothetical protein